jgi:predicted glycosyltransferase
MNKQPRLLIATVDSFGLGHFMRGLKIAYAFQALYPSLSTLIVTGCPIAAQYEVSSGVKLLNLPPVTKDEKGNRISRDPQQSFIEVKAIRRDLLLRATQDFEPTLVIVDNSPTGMDGDAIPTLKWLKSPGGNAKVVLGLRDIVGNPAAIREYWRSLGVYEFIDEIYDKIFVFGVPEFDNPIKNYGLSAAVEKKLVFVGFIAGSSASTSAPNSVINRMQRPTIVVTVGGGEDGHKVIEAFLTMIANFGSALNVSSIVISGPLMPPLLRAEMAAVASSLGVEFETFVTNMVPYIARADVVVSMGGYNTTMEILTHAKRALIIPRVGGRDDQLLRARRLADLGLIDFLETTELTPLKLRDRLERLIASDSSPLEEARAAGRLPMNGAEVLARVCEPLLFQLN